MFEFQCDLIRDVGVSTEVICAGESTRISRNFRNHSSHIRHLTLLSFCPWQNKLVHRFLAYNRLLELLYLVLDGPLYNLDMEPTCFYLLGTISFTQSPVKESTKTCREIDIY